MWLVFCLRLCWGYRSFQWGGWCLAFLNLWLPVAAFRWPQEDSGILPEYSRFRGFWEAIWQWKTRVEQAKTIETPWEFSRVNRHHPPECIFMLGPWTRPLAPVSWPKHWHSFLNLSAKFFNEQKTPKLVRRRESCSWAKNPNLEKRIRDVSWPKVVLWSNRNCSISAAVWANLWSSSSLFASMPNVTGTPVVGFLGLLENSLRVMKCFNAGPCYAHVGACTRRFWHGLNGFHPQSPGPDTFSFSIASLRWKEVSRAEKQCNIFSSRAAWWILLDVGITYQNPSESIRIHQNQAIQQAIRRQFAGPPTIYQGKTSRTKSWSADFFQGSKLLPRTCRVIQDLLAGGFIRYWKTLRAWRFFSPLTWDIHGDIHGDVMDVMVDGEGSKMIKA